VKPTIRTVLVAVAAFALGLLVVWLQSDSSDGGLPEGPMGTEGEEWSVEYVNDGDTFVASLDGREESVRIIGIDTPEYGECGYEEAREALSGWVEGRAVILIPGATTDRDQYGRLLRYVEVDGTDVGLWLVETGYAEARFDYRTGQPHGREDEYIAADAAVVSYCPELD